MSETTQTTPVTNITTIDAPDVDQSSISFARKFFQSAIDCEHLAQGYVLRGQNLAEAYQLVLDIARVVNCQNQGAAQSLVDSAVTCACNSCRWIADNAHPGVLTVSRLTYWVDEDGGDLSEDDIHKMRKGKKSLPKDIKTSQIARLIHQLGISSEFYRIVIFVNGDVTASPDENTIPAPYDWRHISEFEGKHFSIRPLSRYQFNASSANRFLKTLEEPPGKTLFFFLTDHESSLLDTIVSRCQVIPVNSERPRSVVQSVDEAVTSFLDEQCQRLLRESNFYAVIEDFQQFMLDDQGLTVEQALTVMESYFYNRFQAVLKTSMGFGGVKKVLNEVDTARQMIKSKTHTEQTLVNLFYHLAIIFKRTPEILS